MLYLLHIRLNLAWQQKENQSEKKDNYTITVKTALSSIILRSIVQLEVRYETK